MSFNFMAVITICSDLESPKIKFLTVFIVFPSICHVVMGPDAMILVFLIFLMRSLVFPILLFSSISLH